MSACETWLKSAPDLTPSPGTTAEGSGEGDLLWHSPGAPGLWSCKSQPRAAVPQRKRILTNDCKVFNSNIMAANMPAQDLPEDSSWRS
jgi:hypothetical protein